MKLYALALAAVLTAGTASAQDMICTEAGPQTPRDISNYAGTNPADFDFAPPAAEMNLCNIHTHTNAEHKGPGFSVFVDNSAHGGYACDGTADLSEAELDPSADGVVKAGETIEVHWVYTTCPEVGPPPGLGACVICEEGRQLRVETQVYLVVNDDSAVNFIDFAKQDGVNQPYAVPFGTGEPVVFRGSTTGPSFDNYICSPFEVTWSVRPDCAKVSAASVNAWYADNTFEEDHSHGVRQLMTRPAYLSEIGDGH